MISLMSIFYIIHADVRKCLCVYVRVNVCRCLEYVRVCVGVFEGGIVRAATRTSWQVYYQKIRSLLDVPSMIPA